jgi:hypothetical protein
VGDAGPVITATVLRYAWPAIVGDDFLIGVSAGVRKATGVKAGGEVDADVELDTEPRDVVVPRDLPLRSTVMRTPDGTSRPCRTATGGGW